MKQEQVSVFVLHESHEVIDLVRGILRPCIKNFTEVNIHKEAEDFTKKLVRKSHFGIFYIFAFESPERSLELKKMLDSHPSFSELRQVPSDSLVICDKSFRERAYDLCVSGHFHTYETIRPVYDVNHVRLTIDLLHKFIHNKASLHVSEKENQQMSDQIESTVDSLDKLTSQVDSHSQNSGEALGKISSSMAEFFKHVPQEQWKNQVSQLLSSLPESSRQVLSEYIGSGQIRDEISDYQKQQDAFYSDIRQAVQSSKPSREQSGARYLSSEPEAFEQNHTSQAGFHSQRSREALGKASASMSEFFEYVPQEQLKSQVSQLLSSLPESSRQILSESIGSGQISEEKSDYQKPQDSFYSDIRHEAQSSMTPREFSEARYSNSPPDVFDEKHTEENALNSIGQILSMFGEHNDESFKNIVNPINQLLDHVPREQWQQHLKECISEIPESQREDIFRQLGEGQIQHNIQAHQVRQSDFYAEIRQAIKQSRLQKKKNILVAEDHPVTQKMVTAVLESKGFEVHVASNGVEAIERSRELKPDLIFLDVEMPIMDGLKALSVIRLDNTLGNIPVIMLTSHSDKEVFKRCIVAGAQDYVLKSKDAQKTLKTLLEKAVKALN